MVSVKPAPVSPSSGRARLGCAARRCEQSDKYRDQQLVTKQPHCRANLALAFCRNIQPVRQTVAVLQAGLADSTLNTSKSENPENSNKQDLGETENIFYVSKNINSNAGTATLLQNIHHKPCPCDTRVKFFKDLDLKPFIHKT